jgi:hypothetical protein
MSYRFFEGFGLAQLEAAKLESGVITSNVQTLLETVNDSRMLLNPHKPKSVLQALRAGRFEEAHINDYREKALHLTSILLWEFASSKTAPFHLWAHIFPRLSMTAPADPIQAKFTISPTHHETPGKSLKLPPPYLGVSQGKSILFYWGSRKH